mgnify:CR=1 FL=1
MQKKRSGRSRKLEGPEKEAQARKIEELAIAAGFSLAQPWTKALASRLGLSHQRVSAAHRGASVRPETLEKWRLVLAQP